MKFEMVGFYPSENKKSKLLGTLHIYIIDIELDVRGIQVFGNLKTMFFQLPHFMAFDDGQKVRYPHIRFTNNEKQKELMNFLHTVCKKERREQLK